MPAALPLSQKAPTENKAGRWCARAWSEGLDGHPLGLATESPTAIAKTRGGGRSGKERERSPRGLRPKDENAQETDVPNNAKFVAELKVRAQQAVRRDGARRFAFKLEADFPDAFGSFAQ